jgi:YD repeat-containing protein
MLRYTAQGRRVAISFTGGKTDTQLFAGGYC